MTPSVTPLPTITTVWNGAYGITDTVYNGGLQTSIGCAAGFCQVATLRKTPRKSRMTCRVRDVSAWRPTDTFSCEVVPMTEEAMKIPFPIGNSGTLPITLWIEPWGDMRTIPPGGKVIVHLWGPSPPQPEIDVGVNSITLYGWAGCYYDID